jgi:hypothetical protein
LTLFIDEQEFDTVGSVGRVYSHWC